MDTLSEHGARIPDILLPTHIDLKTWAVIACDQYTQDEAYWKETARVADGKPSTLNLVYPEVYLGKPDKDERIKTIQRTMREYLAGGIFSEAKQAVYIERATEYGRTRRGLVLAIDLERYEWKPGAKALIRATEATVPERIPPRMEIRRGAALELPHIMLLANDPSDALVGGAGAAARSRKPLYDGELMHRSGRITGWSVNGEEAEKSIGDALKGLAESGTDKNGDTFLFAVGDGNHSLATAKAVWDEHKKSLSAAERETSRVRFALVEIVNIYDGGLTFEPIHRVIFNQNADQLMSFVRQKLGGTLRPFNSEQELSAFVSETDANGARYGFVCGSGLFALETGITDLAIAALQPALDDYLDAHSADKGKDTDYIHGADDVVRLGKKPGALAVLLPPIAKDSFFQTINERGPLPRKSFSMGEASEKRFYVEARRLF